MLEKRRFQRDIKVAQNIKTDPEKMIKMNNYMKE